MELKIIIDPVAKPRMTRADKWKKRKIVEDYRAYKDELKLSVPFRIRPVEMELQFNIKMSESWTRKKKEQLRGKPHQIKPDIDNLIKGFLDALYEKDEAVWKIKAEKLWSDEGSITISS